MGADQDVADALEVGAPVVQVDERPQARPPELVGLPGGHALLQHVDGSGELAHDEGAPRGGGAQRDQLVLVPDDGGERELQPGDGRVAGPDRPQVLDRTRRR
ncbi:hypothetical protein HP550_16220 [Cellulomonas humilata]|uniref:Uncharacterized protein n=1 Tax=Cellulomonas humilata TaxID=144055 RepID=A0A7Y6A5G4_9CELL|nr:hypothetical protein [Cellulomonas humilata]NUU18799.1 hypothetical protein [Cellulomonas humilata]